MADSSLDDKVAKEVAKCEQLCSLVVARTEPMRVFQRMLWNQQVLRAELTALRDCMKDGRPFNVQEMQRRFAGTLEAYNGLMAQGLGVIINDDLSVVEGVKSAKLWKQ